MNKTVSVVIPTYKRSEMLERAIESCLRQTYTNIEIIIVDDNNPRDDYRIQTEKFIKKYKNNKKIKYIKMKKNGGGAAARNFGIKNSTGEYIVFLDDDDEFHEDKIEKQLQFMLKNKLDASFSDEEIFDSNKKLLYKRTYSNFDKENILAYHLSRLIVGTQTFMFKKSVLDEINGFDIFPSGQDFMLMYKTIIHCFNVGYLPESLVNIYIHEGERISTGKRKLEGERMLFEIKKKHFDILSFMQKKEVNFVWKINLFRYYRKNKSFKLLFVLLNIATMHPFNFFKSIISYSEKRF